MDKMNPSDICLILRYFTVKTEVYNPVVLRFDPDPANGQNAPIWDLVSLALFYGQIGYVT